LGFTGKELFARFEKAFQGFPSIIKYCQVLPIIAKAYQSLLRFDMF
jgi:hypothetical protein